MFEVDDSSVIGGDDRGHTGDKSAAIVRERELGILVRHKFTILLIFEIEVNLAGGSECVLKIAQIDGGTLRTGLDRIVGGGISESPTGLIKNGSAIESAVAVDDGIRSVGESEDTDTICGDGILLRFADINGEFGTIAREGIILDPTSHLPDTIFEV